MPPAHDPRRERPGPVPRRLDLHLAACSRSAPSWAAVADVARLWLAVFLMSQVLGQLLVQGRLQHRFGQLLQRPVRAGHGTRAGKTRRRVAAELPSGASVLDQAALPVIQ